MRPKAFFFHYNKPASRSAGRNILSVHYAGQCHLVHDVICTGVNLATRQRKRQPYCVIAGKGFVTIEGETAIISKHAHSEN